MAETIITVQGSARSEQAPERATVRFSVSAEGPQRHDVADRASAAVTAVREALTARHDTETGPILRWSVGALSVTAQRPWTPDGTPAEVMHRAHVGGQAVVSELDALPELIDVLVVHSEVAIDGLDWSLTESTRSSITAEVRSRAVKDAVTKATVYARSIGLSSVTAIALADPGMLGDPGGGGPVPRMERAAMMAGGDGAFFVLRPEPIVVEAVVDARFSAS